MQIWKDIEGYKGHYQISNYGNVRSLKKDAFLMKGGYLKGYKIINLGINEQMNTIIKYSVIHS